MLIQQTNHLEAFSIIHQPLIFEEETQGLVMNCHPDLTLPMVLASAFLELVTRALSKRRVENSGQQS
jgi:hypothetical protein